MAALRRIPTIFIVALYATALWFPHHAFAQPGPTPVIVQAATKVMFADRVEALGTLRALQTTRITANVTEIISAIYFHDGQRVASEEILVEMTSAEEKALLDEAVAESEEAKRQLDRVRSLADRDVASRSLFDQRQREYNTARARLIAIESRLKDRIIRAPYAGVLGLLNISLGDLVQPGDLIATLNDDSQMKLDFSVPEIYLATLKPGIPIVATSRAFPERQFSGQVVSIDNQVDPVTRSIVVRAMLPNPDRLLVQGMLMNVVLMKNKRESLSIAEEALLPLGSGNSVFVVVEREEQQVVEKREVSIGMRQPGAVEITSGLSEKDQVVIHGGIKLRDGAPVSIHAIATESESLADLLKNNANPKPGE